MTRRSWHKEKANVPGWKAGVEEGSRGALTPCCLKRGRHPYALGDPGPVPAQCREDVLPGPGVRTGLTQGEVPSPRLLLPGDHEAGWS